MVTFLACYSGRTLEAYRHDLRGFCRWSSDHGVVMEASDAHIELFRGWMEDPGARGVDDRPSALDSLWLLLIRTYDGRIRADPDQYVRRLQVHASDARGLDCSELRVFLFTAGQ